nr:FAD-binding oxidoreductase [Rhizobium sp. Q54]
MQHFRYVIIGAGMMGAAAARHLSQWTEGVALIGPAEPADIRSHSGVFSSHYDEARITRTIDADPGWARLANASISRYAEIERESGIDFYTEAGCLLVGPSRGQGPSYVGNVLAAARRLDVEAGLLDDAALARQFSCFSFQGGSEGVWEEKGAGHINPRRLVKAQTMLAERQGCALVGETVSEIRDEGGRVAVTTDEGGLFTADKVLVAAGGFSINEGLLKPRLDLKVYARTVAFFELDEAQLARLGPVPSLIWKWNEEDDGIYLLPPVRYPDGKTYLKIGGDPDDLLLEREADIRAWFRSGGRETTHRHLVNVMRRLMPPVDLSRTSMAACVTSFTPTGYPAISWSESSRIGVLAGGCGAAAKSSDEIGRLGAELLFHGAIRDEAYDADFGARFA